MKTSNVTELHVRIVADAPPVFWKQTKSGQFLKATRVIITDGAGELKGAAVTSATALLLAPDERVSAP